ncbi:MULTISPECIES: PAAR domain-containing protein [Cupriavidus]
MQEIIRKRDSTDHGGTVLEGFSQTRLNGRRMAGAGSRVACPKCRNVQTGFWPPFSKRPLRRPSGAGSAAGGP